MSQDRVMRDAQTHGFSKLNKSSSNNNNNRKSWTDTRATAASIIFYGGDDENSDDGAMDQARITQEVADEFTSDHDWRTMPRRLNRLIEILNQWNTENTEISSCPFSADPKEARRLALTAAVMTSAKKSLIPSFQAFFRASLEARQPKDDHDEDQMEEDDDNAAEDKRGINNDNKQIFENGQELAMFEHLRVLGWLRKNGILVPPLGAAIHRVILNKVRTSIESDFEEEGFFEALQDWCESTVETWVYDLVGPDAFEIGQWSSRLKMCTAECFSLVRIDEIFDIVCEFPESSAAVAELRTVLGQTKMHSQLGDALRQSLVRRLNHPGANTSQIIDCYINTIKVLREIDPSERLLEVVTEPVRSYLRGRNDTVRCIITSLTDAEVGGDLYEELRRQDAKPLETVQDDSDDEESCPTFDWQPAPSITNPKGSFLGGAKAGGGDILSMLVSIYGSKELFVNEYRVMLADKLLANLDFNTDKEVHTLELLKLRFGELSMRNCEIMIKDMDDSKRAVANIHSTLKSNGLQKPVVDTAVISHIFWPTLQNDTLKHHPRIQADLDRFSAEFVRLKNPRRLIWLNQLGTVQLELDVEEDGPDGKPTIETREFNCAPLLATLISHFEDREQWSAEDLSNETGIAEHIIQKRMGYWVSNRVVKIVPSSSHPSTVVYQVASQEHMLQSDHDMDMEFDHGDSLAVSLHAQEEEEMGVFESYIVGMLTNMGQLPLDRIHNMLKMYVSGSDVKFNKTPQQLSAFLKYLCKQEKLECGPDGMYKLFKK